MRQAVRLLTIVVAACISAATWSLAEPGTARARGDRRVIDLRNGKKLIHGRTAGDWAIEWHQLVSSFPTTHNPAYDDTGARQFHGQRGPVWLLSGAFNSSSVSRRTKVPKGKALFFPIVNVAWDSIGSPAPLSLDEIRRLNRETIDSVDPETLFLSIDGVPVRDVDRGRVVSKPFVYCYPDGNLGESQGQATVRGIYGPAISEGYWAMVAPLPPGEHVLRWGATVGPPYSFTLDITYEIEVVDTGTKL